VAVFVDCGSDLTGIRRSQTSMLGKFVLRVVLGGVVLASEERLTKRDESRSCAYASLSEVPIPLSPSGRVACRELLVAEKTKRIFAFGDRDASRYLSVLQSPTGSVRVALKNGSWSHANNDPVAYLYEGCDVDLRDLETRESCFKCKKTKIAEGGVSANFAVAQDANSSWWGLGGELQRANSTVAVYPSKTDGFFQRSGGVTAFHGGCVERREKYAPRCEFDGRFSIASDFMTVSTGDASSSETSSKKATLLYARERESARRRSLCERRRSEKQAYRWRALLAQLPPPRLR